MLRSSLGLDTAAAWLARLPICRDSSRGGVDPLLVVGPVGRISGGSLKRRGPSCQLGNHHGLQDALPATARLFPPRDVEPLRNAGAALQHACDLRREPDDGTRIVKSIDRRSRLS
jgi:hypothetical protein